MENASKALILAGSVLITILVISLAVYTFNNMGRSARNMVSMDEQEVTNYNSKIRQYIGNNINGTSVKALAQYIRSLDQTALNKNDGIRRTSMYFNSKSGTLIVGIDSNGKLEYGGISSIVSNKYYSVQGEYDSNGLITTVIVKEN